MNGRFVAKHQPHRTKPNRGEWIVGDRWTGAVHRRYRSEAEAREGVRLIEETYRAVREALAATA